MPPPNLKTSDATHETVRQLYEISSRIDERIKYLVEKQNDMSDKIEKLASNMTETAVRVAVLEKSDWEKTKDTLDDLDKKVAVLDKQFNNGVKSDVQELKEKVRTLEFSNEHNTSYRNKGEFRIQWWLDAAWKVVQIVGAAALAYYLSKKS